MATESLLRPTPSAGPFLMPGIANWLSMKSRAQFQRHELRPPPGLQRTWTGVRQRLDLLTDHGITLPADVGAAGGVPTDDLLDTCAAAGSADRIGGGPAHKIGDEAGGYVWI